LIGALIGWIFGLFHWLYAIVGALMGLAMYAMQAGRRDFRAVTSLRPTHFDIVTDVDVVDQALRLLSGSANVPR
jgi:cytochrome b561